MYYYFIDIHPNVFFRNDTLNEQGHTRLSRPALAHFFVAVARISAASPSLLRLELGTKQAGSGQRVLAVWAAREQGVAPQP